MKIAKPTEPFAPVRVYLSPDSARKGFDSRDPGRRARIVAILVVTAETVLMTVILIVEDDVFLRDDAEMMIQDWGHDTISASDVDEALSLLRSPQQIDALFTDIYLKRAILGGYELAHQAIKLRLNLRVLYTTGNTINDKMKAMFVEGAHFLQKPYTQHQLQNSVKALLAA
jgi:DNA-binding NtrC family response regulator